MCGLFFNQNETSRQEFAEANKYKWIKNLFDAEHSK